MAEDKPSFILYCDQIGLFKGLPDDVAGKLIKHIFEYVNDENPETDDLLLKIAFEPIKMQLKRDLRRYEKFREKQSENGKLGGRPKKINELDKTQEKPKNPSLFSETQKSLNVNVNVNDNVNETVILKNQKKAWNDDHFLKLIILEKYPTVSKLKEPKPEQLDGLLDKYTKNEIESTLEAMENYKKLLKNCTTVFLTLKNWLERREKDKTQSNGKFITNAEKSAGLDRMVEQSKEHLQQLANKYGK